MTFLEKFRWQDLVRVFTKAPCNTAGTSSTKKELNLLCLQVMIYILKETQWPGLYHWIKHDQNTKHVLWHQGHLARTTRVCTIKLSHPPEKGCWTLPVCQNPSLAGPSSWAAPGTCSGGQSQVRKHSNNLLVELVWVSVLRNLFQSCSVYPHGVGCSHRCPHRGVPRHVCGSWWRKLAVMVEQKKQRHTGPRNSGPRENFCSLVVTVKL